MTVETDLDHLFSKVELFWNTEDRLRIRIPNGSPAVIEGVYLEGQNKDVNIELAKPLNDFEPLPLRVAGRLGCRVGRVECEASASRAEGEQVSIDVRRRCRSMLACASRGSSDAARRNPRCVGHP